jgi:hypothetical protein
MCVNSDIRDAATTIKNAHLTCLQREEVKNEMNVTALSELC